MVHCNPTITRSDGITIVTPTDSFDLRKTLTCGQLFHYYNLGDKLYCLIYKDSFVICGQSHTGALMFASPQDAVEKIWVPYLDLNTDYDKSMALIELDSFALAAYENSKGIHILKQDPLEMCISYIISQNNKIENISQIVKKLSRLHGKFLGNLTDNMMRIVEIHSFPNLQTLNDMSLQDWKDASTGFRSTYLLSFVKYMYEHQDHFQALGLVDHNTLIDVLQAFDGIGPKVSNCISLFGYHHLEAFPIDLWIERIIFQKYGGINPAKKFGDMAGVVQQYMFHYARNESGLTR